MMQKWFYIHNTDVHTEICVYITINNLIPSKKVCVNSYGSQWGTFLTPMAQLDRSSSLNLILGRAVGMEVVGTTRSGHGMRRLLGLKPYTLVEISINRWIPSLRGNFSLSTLDLPIFIQTKSVSSQAPSSFLSGHL